MIRPTDIFNINFYNKEVFHGSWKEMRYQIERHTIQDENTGTEKLSLLVTTWPGPYNFASTDNSLKKTAFFEFSNEGLHQIAEYLNEQYLNCYCP